MARGCDAFEVRVPGDIEALWAEVKRKADEEGLLFQGNASAGRFSGKGVSGIYQTAGDRVTIRITEKPWILPCRAIESRFRNFFEGGKIG